MIDKVIKFLHKIEKNKTYDINQLYIGEYGKMHMTKQLLPNDTY